MDKLMFNFQYGKACSSLELVTIKIEIKNRGLN